MDNPPRTPSRRRGRVRALVASLFLAAWAVGLPAMGAERTTLTLAGKPRADGAIELRSLHPRWVTARQAAGTLVSMGRVPPAEAAVALSAAGHPPREIEQALTATYRIASADAARLIAEAGSTPPRVLERRDIPRHMEVTTCVYPDGRLVQCPTGGTATGGSRLSGGVMPAPGAMDWSGVTLSPPNDAVAGGELIIRPPPGATLPPVQVHLAGQALSIVQQSPQEVRAALPAQTTQGPLSMTNLNNGLSGSLAATYRVRATGLLDLVNVDATGHDWTNSYLFALLSFYVYSDTLGSPATSQADLRALLKSWGMDDVQFIERPAQHLRAVVAWGPKMVVVVFRGTEMHASSYCVLEMLFGGICGNVPVNWLTNLSFAPLYQRPDWGMNVRTHPGFDQAVEALYQDIMAAVKPRLTPSRRLFITGHSLGGAMATLFAFRAWQFDGIMDPRIYTYGAPRAANVQFRTLYELALGSRTQRWQNRSDPIPNLPPGAPFNLPPPLPLETYQHIGRLNFLPASGAAQLHSLVEPLQPATTVSQLVVGDHMMAGSQDSYAFRIYSQLPQQIRAQVPAPP